LWWKKAGLNQIRQTAQDTIGRWVISFVRNARLNFPTK
jgi:hypothetical protein